MKGVRRPGPGRLTLTKFLDEVRNGDYSATEREALTAQYAAVLSAIEHEDGRRWVLFGAFLAGIGLLVPAIEPAPEGYPRTVVFGAGLFLSIAGWLVIWRNNVYLKDRSHLAMALQRILLKDRPLLWLYDDKAHIPKGRLEMHRPTSGAMLVPYFTAWALMRTTLWVSAVLWTAGLAWQWPALRPNVVTWAAVAFGFIAFFVAIETINRIRRYAS